jgi:two-component system response regulator FixJ
MIYVVDDDRSVREALSALLDAAGYRVKVYERAEEFLDDASEPQSGCLLIDVRLPGMNGRDLQRAVVEAGLPVEVIVMTAHGDIPMAVAAVKEGAVDFLEKPFDPNALLDSIRTALATAERRRHEHDERKEVRNRFSSLSQREQDVMRLLVDGCSNKVVARRLGISPRTAEWHRSRVLEKMEAKSLSVLVRQALLLERRFD